MTIWRRLIIAGVAGLMLSAAGLAVAPQWQWPALPRGLTPPPVRPDNVMNAAKVALGRRLFYDPALSANATLSCAECHQQARGFTDGLPTHPGVTGEMGVRNVPGLANVGWRTGLTWADDSITTLEAQAMVPMTGEHPIEMGMKGGEDEIARRLSADPCYRTLFTRAFPAFTRAFPAQSARIDFKGVTAALGAFQRTMIAFDTPYDRGAMRASAAKGQQSFAAAGCASCHGGPHFTDDRLHYVGTAKPSEPDASAYGGKPPPPGFEPPPERFRTPGLRNVAVTGPWLHDGSATSLDMAIRRHAAGQLAGVDMPALLAFLDSLTDASFLKAAHLAKPAQSCPV